MPAIKHFRENDPHTAGLRALKSVEEVLKELEGDPERSREALQLIESHLRVNYGLTLARGAGQPSRLVGSVDSMLEIVENPHEFLDRLKIIEATSDPDAVLNYTHLANLVIKEAISKITSAFRETGIIAKQIQ